MKLQCSVTIRRSTDLLCSNLMQAGAGAFGFSIHAEAPEHERSTATLDCGLHVELQSAREYRSISVSKRLMAAAGVWASDSLQGPR